MIFIIILFLGILYLSKYNKTVKSFFSKITNQPVNYIILLLLVTFGYYSSLDYTERYGCVIYDYPEFKSLLFSSISFLLVLASFLFKNRKLKLLFISLELLFWIFKLFYLKGGYVVGLSAAYDIKILLFDSITLLLRLLIINSLFKIKYSNLKLIISMLLLMTIKVYVFPVQLIDVYERYSSLKRSEITKTKIEGNWSGIMTYGFRENNVERTMENNIIFKIDSNHLIFKDSSDNIYEYFIEFDQEYSGKLLQTKGKEGLAVPFFFIQKLTSDSIELHLMLRVYHYKILCKKE